MGRALDRAPSFVRRIYTLCVVVVAWVFFRADDLPHALTYLAAIVGLGRDTSNAYPLALFVDFEIIFILAISVFAGVPALRHWIDRLAELESRVPRSFGTVKFIALAAVLLLCAMSLAAGTHNPFIYFRF